MEKLATKIMNSFENFLEEYDTCSKMKMVYNWQQLEREIKSILEEKEEKKVEYSNNYKLFNYYECLQCKNSLVTDRDKDQVIRCECGAKYYVHNNCIIPIKEAEVNSWQDENIRKWKCGCDSVMACESSEDRVVTCGICNRRYAWDSKMKRMTYISETGRGEGDTSGFEVVEVKERLGIKEGQIVNRPLDK